MVKGSNSLRNKKLHSSKPYDVSNSFVKKVTSHVTNLLPQPAWLSKWFSSTADDEDQRRDNLNSNDSGSEDDDNTNGHPPPTKRAKIPLNKQFPANSFKVSPIINDEVSNQRAGPSRIIPNDFITDTAVAGPSGINMRPQLVSSTPNVQSTAPNLLSGSERKLNGDDRSESSESTSGCSSLVPQANRQFQTSTSVTNSLSARRRSIDEKLNFTGHLQSPRSLFSDRSLSRSPRLNSSFSRRRPSFNVSTFGSPVLAKDRTSIQNRIVTSPFYSGRTTYGGASAYRRSKDGFPFANEVPTVKRGVQVKPVNCDSDSLSTMSSTARRILEALEQFSSPVHDAKRIPVQPSTPPLCSKRKRPNEPGPSPAGLRIGESPRTPNAARPLTVPTVPDLLKLKHREKLQDSMEAARLIAASSKNDSLLSHTFSSNQGYKLRCEEADSGRKHGGKIKYKEKDLEEETVEEVKLPNITLEVTSLPKFDFVVPPASVTPSVSCTFKFASPITVSENVRTCSPINNFTFSKPLSIGDTDNTKKVNCIDTSIPNPPTNFGESKFKSGSDNKLVLPEKGNSKSVLRKNNSENSEVCFGIRPATELKSGSVMDILGKMSNSIAKDNSKQDNSNNSISLDKFKPAPGMWECSSCMIRNKVDAVKCVCCETPRAVVPAPSSTTVTTAKTWECNSCHASNSVSSTSCTKCTVTKPGQTSSQSKEPSLPQDKPVSSLSGFGNKFKPPSNSWECTTCLVRNPESLTKCQACETKCPTLADKSSASPTQSSSKPLTNSGFGDKFKKPEGAWECPDCMLSNKQDAFKCVACEAAKPGTGTTETKSATKFNFLIPAEASGFKFGIDKAGDSTKDSSAPTLNSVAQNFKFGETKVTVASSFSFGVSSNTTNTTKSDAATVSTSTVTAPVFSFGTTAFSTPSSNTVVKPADTSSVSQPAFSFGAAQSSKTQSPSSSEVKQPAELPKKRRASDAGDTDLKDSQLKETKLVGIIKAPATSSETTSDGKKKTEPVKKVTFSFGTSSGPTSFPSEKPNSSTKIAESAKPSFNFGASSAGLNFGSGKSPGFNFTGTAGAVFGSSTQATTTISMAESITTGASKAAMTTATTTITSSTSSALPVFGSSKTVSSGSSAPVFGQTPTTTTSVSSPAFGIGLQTTTPSTFSFGSQAKPFGGNESASVSTSKSQTPTFGSITSTTTVPVFGTTTTSTTTTTAAPSITSTSLPSFGTATSAPSFSLGTRAAIPAFGTPSTSTTSKTTVAPASFASPNFSSGFTALSDQNKSASKSVPNAASFTFGANTSSSTSSLASPAPFPFGGVQNDQGLAPKGTFSFGTPSNNNPLAAASTPAANSVFGFGSANPTPAFAFGAGASTTGNTSTTSVFGSGTSSASATPAAGPVFGAAVSSSFGSSNPSGGSSGSTSFSAPTFSFGASATQPSSGIFGFTGNQSSGSSNTPGQSFAASTPNFNFGQAQTPQASQSPAQPALPTFNPNVRPSFNFTGGETPTFTAPPPGTTAPARRIKKAVRRSQHLR